MANAASPINPTKQTERIHSLDLLRGIALLGILIMNIQSFAMPPAAYLNPTAYGDLEGINRWVWTLSHIFADQKFMTLFSMLFGAGILLVSDRAVAKTGRSAGLHYARNAGLLVIGLIHAHLIWFGDILVGYALCGFFVYLFRNRKPRTMLIFGLLFFSVHPLLYALTDYSLAFMTPADLAEIKSGWAPFPELIREEIAAFTGSLSEQIRANSAAALEMETLVFMLLFVWRITGLMLIGMALYRWGVLSAGRSRGFYLRGMVFAFGAGFWCQAVGGAGRVAQELIFSGHQMVIDAQYKCGDAFFRGCGGESGVLFARHGFCVWCGLFTGFVRVDEKHRGRFCHGIFHVYGISLELLGQFVRRIWIYVRCDAHQ